MSTFIFRSNAPTYSVEFKNWHQINRVVLAHRPRKLLFKGYEDIFEWAIKYFGFSKFFRHTDGQLQYEFTEEEWLIFKLKWL